MFKHFYEKFTKKINKKTDEIIEEVTPKVVTNTKKSVKQQFAKDLEENLPVIIGVVTIGLTLFTAYQVRKPKSVVSSITIINNYYNGGGPK